MNEKRIILRDIAREAGVHHSTVSRALRNDRRVKGATIVKIQALARKLGYVPDPMLGSLAIYRAAKVNPGYQSTLAWITNHFTRDGWRENFYHYFQGASEQANKLGYCLEEFWLREPGLTQKRASQILRARGISGLIIAPQPRAKMRIRLNWEDFSAVAMGYTLAWPPLHIVTNHQFHSTLTTVRRVRAHGYRRVGLVIDHLHDSRIDHGWTGGFLAMQQYWPSKERIPIFSCAKFTPARLNAWIRRYRPDVIVGHGWLVKVVEKLGYRIPEEIGMASLGLDSNQKGQVYSGVDEHPRISGVQAVDLLVGMIRRGERGFPEVPQRVLTQSSWIEGKTLVFHNRKGS